MDDLTFVQRCVKGDKLAWDEFLDKYSRLIYNYIHSVLKVKGAEVAKDNIHDLFQEICLGLVNNNFRKLRSFKAKNGCSLASWLRQVVINHAIDYLRKSKPTLSLDGESDAEFNLQDILADDAPAITETLNSEERLARLTECIEALGREDKYFLTLYLHKGLTLDELKAHFRSSRSAVDMRKSRIIDQLRDCFRRKGFL